MPSSNTRVATYLRITALALLWGSGFLWIKIALRGFTPYQIVLVRLALGGLVLLAVLFAGGQRLPRGGSTWLHLAVAASVGNIAPYLLFAVAERRIDSAVAGMLNATTPLWTMVVAVITRHEPGPHPVRLVGLFTGLAGTAVLLTPWRSGTQFMSWGALAALLASLSYGVTYVYVDRFLVSRKLSPLSLSTAQLLAASAITAAALPATQGWDIPSWRADAALSLAILGILGTGIAYVLNYRIIADDGASAASVVTYLLPVVAIVLGAIVLSETPTLHAVIGIVVILAGVGLARWRLPQRRPEPSAGQLPANW